LLREHGPAMPMPDLLTVRRRRSDLRNLGGFNVRCPAEITCILALPSSPNMATNILAPATKAALLQIKFP
jgi:hypothetical protein